MNANTADYTITVASGTGQATAPSQTALVIRSARLNNICIKAPSAAASYTIAIEDTDGFIIYHESGVIGTTSLICDRVMRNNIVITISDATVDGTYEIRLYMES